MLDKAELLGATLLDKLLLDEELNEEELDELEQLLALDELELDEELLFKLEEELLELDIELEELEQLTAGGMKGVVRSAPQACSNILIKKNASALPRFDWRKVNLIIAV